MIDDTLTLRLDDQVAIVTGAGSGIGAAIARLLARQGAGVVIADRRADAGLAVAGLIEQAGGQAISVATDVADAGQVEAMVKNALDRFGRLDVLVNNAAVDLIRPFWEVDDAAWHDLIGVNLTGCFLCARTVTPHLLAQGSGAIVNISSVLALATMPGKVAYTTAKAGVIGMTRAMALDLAGRGVRVNCVLPGSTDTPMMWDGIAPADLAHVAGEAAAAIPVGRVAAPEEIARVVLFLVSPAASYLTGAVVAADGGLLSKIATDY
jgi:3-oxoacyl-[acyl-carrier protein] reductase